MANYIVSSNDPGKMGGSKAKEDIIKFASEDGFIPFRINPYHTNKLAKLLYVKFNLRTFFKSKPIDNVIMQYPIPSEYIVGKFVSMLKMKIRGKFTIWIHDIQGLQSSEPRILKWEIALFNQADILIVHNPKMKSWLVQKGVTSKMVVLGIFDYDNPQPIQPKISYAKTVCFAGNLFKSGFIKEWNPNSQVFVFGPNMPQEHHKSIIPAGQFSPEELTSHLKQNFGLIWDGPSAVTCQGTFGKYLLYNNPHKTSLYISSGIPIIIWDQAALADFVREHRIGLVVANLNDLDNLLASTTPDEYQVLKDNTVKMAEKLRTGYYTHQVIRRVLHSESHLIKDDMQ